jgi:hypothetical protein
MDTARAKFKVGDKVHLSQHGRQYYAIKRAQGLRALDNDIRGRVEGFSRDGDKVRILLDGNKGPKTYDPEHWLVSKKHLWLFV